MNPPTSQLLYNNSCSESYANRFADAPVCGIIALPGKGVMPIGGQIGHFQALDPLKRELKPLPMLLTTLLSG